MESRKKQRLRLEKNFAIADSLLFSAAFWSNAATGFKRILRKHGR
jgi:hypothetical protein